MGNVLMTTVRTVRKIRSGFPGRWARLIYSVAFPHQAGIIHLEGVRGHSMVMANMQSRRGGCLPSLTLTQRQFFKPLPVVVQLLSRVRLFVTPWTGARQAPLSMGSSRQEHWSGLPFTSPGDLPDPGTEPASPALAGGLLTSEPPGKPLQPLDRRSNPHGGASSPLPFTAQHRLPGLRSRLLPVSPPSDLMTFFFPSMVSSLAAPWTQHSGLCLHP